MDREQSFSAERHFSAVEQHVPRVIKRRARHVDESMFYRDIARELPDCPFTKAKRFALGERYVLESWRLESDRQGYRVGLSPGSTIVQAPPKRATVSYVCAYNADDMPETNGSWRKVLVDRDSRRRLYISAVCNGEACLKGPAPARTRKFSGNEWTRPQTCCVGCVTARRRSERAPAAQKTIDYQAARNARLITEGRCVSCATKKGVEEVTHRCKSCLAKSSNARKSWRNEPVQLELV